MGHIITDLKENFKRGNIYIQSLKIKDNKKNYDE